MLGVAVIATGTIIVGIQPGAYATGGVGEAVTGNHDYIEELKTKTAGIDDVGNNVYLVAAGSLAYAGGAKIAKRVLYA